MDQRLANRIILSCSLLLLLATITFLAGPMLPALFPPSTGNPTTTPTATPTRIGITTPTAFPTPTDQHPTPTPEAQNDFYQGIFDTGALKISFFDDRETLSLVNNGSEQLNTDIYAVFHSGLVPQDIYSNYFGPLAFQKFTDNTYVAPASAEPGSETNLGFFGINLSPLIYSVPPLDDPETHDDAAASYSQLVEPILQDFLRSTLFADQKEEFEKAISDANQKPESNLFVREQLATLLETLQNEAELRRALEAGNCNKDVAGFVDQAKRLFILRIPLKAHTKDVLISKSGELETITKSSFSPDPIGPSASTVSVTYDFSGSDLSNKRSVSGSVTLGYEEGNTCVIPVKIEIKDVPTSCTQCASQKADTSSHFSGSFTESNGMLDWPVGHIAVTCEYGCYAGHTGIDFGAHTGTPVRAPSDGVILSAQMGWNDGYGNFMRMDNGIIQGKHIYTLYGHLQKFAKSHGDQVKRGDIIAYTDNTGHSTGPHLHFEVLVGNWAYGNDVNPRKYLN